MAELRFGVVIHGPEAIDSGLFQRLMKFLKKEGSVEAVMSGFTGVAAVVDAGLEGIVDISRRRIPSATLAEMDASFDALILVNSAKSRETAIRFGSIVNSKARIRLTKPFFQVDRDVLIDWSGRGGTIATRVAETLCLEMLKASESPVQVGIEGRWRQIAGVAPGENVWVDGAVVGRATDTDVWIARDDAGMLIARGIALKPEGVRRLGSYDPSSARVRSGVVRRTQSAPRSLRRSGEKGVYLIDHSAEDSVYRCRETWLVVAVGDDTSRIAGNLLYRFGVPIVAIRDGDEDGICAESQLAEGSIALRFRKNTDDIVGQRTREVIFGGGDFIDQRVSPGAMARRIRDIASDLLL